MQPAAILVPQSSRSGPSAGHEQFVKLWREQWDQLDATMEVCSPVCRVRAWSARQEHPAARGTTPAPDGSVQRRSRDAVPRMALTKPEAAAALGISVDSFERHVQPELRVAPAGGGDRSLLRIVCEFL